MEQFSVYEGHMDDLMKKVKRIQNKCRKYGCDFHFAEVGEEIKEVLDLDKQKVKCRFVIVEAEGIAVINDWEFIASVEHTPKGNIFSKAMNDVEIPERYRNTDPICEHCHSNRTRKDTFIIRNSKTGEFKQVGKSCLQDFTHGMSASFAAWLASVKDIFKEAEEAPVSCGYTSRYEDTREVLQYAAETIRKFGYAKTDSPHCTRDKFFDIMMVDTNRTRWMFKDQIAEIKAEIERVHFNAHSAEATEMVDKALEWIQDQEATNDYIHNLKVACSLKNATWKHFGILVSLFPTFNRELEYQAEKAKREAERKADESRSNWIGSVGDRISFTTESVSTITSWETQWGVTSIYKLKDTEGNIYTWKTSNWVDTDKNFIVKATVKDHNEFRGTKQTEVTRCKMTEI